MSDGLSIAVVGGGIGGLSAAVALIRAGVDVRVYEQAGRIGEVGAGIGVAPNGLRVYERLGLRDAVEGAGARYGAGSTYFRADGSVIGEMTTSDASGSYTTLGIHRADLVDVLIDALPPGTVRTGHRLVTAEDDGAQVRLRFENGEAGVFDAVIGADGVHSVVRDSVTGSAELVDSGSIAYRGLVDIADLPAWPTSIAQLWVGEGKHFLTYPVRGGRVINYVAFVPSDRHLAESWSTVGDRESLIAEFDGWDSRVDAVLHAVDTTFWWGLYDREPLSRWSHGRVTLLGDAAHPMLPHLGQGLNQAIEDGAVLAALLRGAAVDEVETALQRYEQVRMPRTAAVQQGARDNGRRYDSGYTDLTRRDEEIQRSKEFRRWLYDYDADEAEAHLSSAPDGPH